ncbi:helix-turn-helix domain-containing protein [Umezawaea sp. Da 62-37]|uniref:helix-turn-helix domain-containing protein n=1 Tax=Umezawaea sp. Da 62-37 TaxID=3075927 RepID=UPI0028F7424E|nr:helix-turn-helix domain-containing protein [Umezawaea sp. Da 62-37]WNV84667.1 helix-turn-helix domain-containing protein [Umezawaea sp. Da 62-37]
MPPNAGPPTGRRASNEARKRLAARRAAVELSEEKGFGTVLMPAIADRAGVSERTLFRMFGTKAGIFWHDPFLERVASRLDEDTAREDPLRAVLDAVEGTARAMGREERDLERRRRALIVTEPELLGAGTQSVMVSGKKLTDRITPPDADDAERLRLMLFAAFTAAALGAVPVDPDEPEDRWVEVLSAAVRVAAFGPLSERG